MKRKLLTMLLVLAVVLSLLPALTVGGQTPRLTGVGDPVVEHPKSFTETVGVRFEESFRMIYVEGGTFTLGWEDGTQGLNGQPDDTIPVPNVTVDDYWISDTVVTQGLWAAVMGSAAPSATTRNNVHASNTWYDAHEFLARLYVLTGKVYYMPTEAQWEFAAKGGNPGHALGHNLLPFPGAMVQSQVMSGTGTGAVRQQLPNILGIYNFLTGHGEWTYNPWNTAHIGGDNPTGIESPIHSQKTRRGGLASTGYSEYHSRLIRSIDGTGPPFRIALSADQSSVPEGMIKPRDIHVPRLNDRDTPNSYRDPRWVTGDNMVWDGNYQGYGGAAMKVWETGEVVLRPHNFNGYDPGDIVGQWYTFNNYGMVIIPNADSPNPDKSRMLIPYMFLDQFTVSTINDRKNINTAGPDVIWPDIYMAPTGRLELKVETSLQASIERNKPAAANPAEQFGQNYESFPYFGGTYSIIQKPVVPGLIPTAQVGLDNIVDAKHYMIDDIYGFSNLADRGQDPALVDGIGFGWWMGYGFGGVHTYRVDVDLPDSVAGTPGNARHSVYEAQPGVNITPQTGGLFRGPWFTVNDVFWRVLGNAAGTSRIDNLYLIVPDMDGNVLNTMNYPMRHLSYQSYERGDSRIFHLRANADIERHPYEQGGTTGYSAGFGQTTWGVAPTARRACPGIPSPVGTQVWCMVNGVRGNVMNCECPIFCPVAQSYTCDGHIDFVGPESVDYAAGAQLTYSVKGEHLPASSMWMVLKFTVDSRYFNTAADAFTTYNGFTSFMPITWKNGSGYLREGTLNVARATTAFGDYDILDIVFTVKDLSALVGSDGIFPSTATDIKLEVLEYSNNADWLAPVIRNDTVTTVIQQFFSRFDGNRDGQIDGRDIAFMMDYYMMRRGDPGWDATAERLDVNGDGRIDVVDLVLVYANFT